MLLVKVDSKLLASEITEIDHYFRPLAPAGNFSAWATSSIGWPVRGRRVGGPGVAYPPDAGDVFKDSGKIRENLQVFDNFDRKLAILSFFKYDQIFSQTLGKSIGKFCNINYFGGGGVGDGS